MNERTIWLPVEPEPWRRTRGRGAHRFTDPEDRAYREEIGYRLRSHYREPETGPIAAILTFSLGESPSPSPRHTETQTLG